MALGIFKRRGRARARRSPGGYGIITFMRYSLRGVPFVSVTVIPMLVPAIPACPDTFSQMPVTGSVTDCRVYSRLVELINVTAKELVYFSI